MSLFGGVTEEIREQIRIEAGEGAKAALMPYLIAIAAIAVLAYLKR